MSEGDVGPDPGAAPGGMQSSPRVRTAGIALGLLALALLAWRFAFVCDDAYISFRYARNLADGLGLVYNPGVEPPVEGYSEFLWVLLMALGMVLGLAPEPVSLTLSVLCALVLVVRVVALISRRSGPTAGATLGSALLLGTLPPLAVWTTSGLATVPFALAVFLLFEAVWAAPRRGAPVLGALAAVAAVLLRADGAWWVAAVCGPAILLLGREREPARRALLAALVGAAVFGLHVAWRHSVYGDWLPNTARAKLGFSGAAFERGGLYLGSFALVFPGLVAALAVGLMGLRGRRLGLPALLVVLATLLYAVLVGGDFMAFGRFLVPGLPFLVLLYGAGVGRLEARWGAGPVLALSAALAALDLLPAFDVHVVPRPVRAPFNFRHNGPKEFRSEYRQWARMRDQAAEWRDLGIALEHVSEPGDSIVFPAVGAVGYFSRLFVYDCNGLVTREVALREPLAIPTSPGHDKTVLPTFFLKDRPTWLSAHFVPAGMAVPPAMTALGEGVVHELGPPLTDRLETRSPGDLLVLVRPR